MGYTTPDTVTGSSVLTAALWNAQVRDNFEAVAKPPNARASRNSTLSLVSGTLTTVAWPQTSGAWDWTTSMRSATVNNERITVPEAGVYSVSTSCIFINSAAYGATVQYNIVRLNSSGVVQDYPCQSLVYMAGYDAAGGSLSCLSLAAAGDYFVVRMTASAGAQAFSSASGPYYFSVVQVSK